MTWRAAMQEALYGSDGFYAKGEPPAAHFRTSVHASPRYSVAVLAMLEATDAALGHPARLDLVDIGAGQGELLAQVLGRADPDLAKRLVARAVEVAPPPTGLDCRITWCPSVPEQIAGLVIASEWLDNVPLDVAGFAVSGPRIVLVDTESGAERAGPPASAEDIAWLREWWPVAPGDRAEVGHPRCAAWADVIRRLERGLAVAADYGHCREGRPRAGTLAAFKEGRAVRPIPDGSRDITAHVAVDACAAAGVAAGATQSLITTQRAALHALGLSGRPPAMAGAASDPRSYLADLSQAAQDAELTDPAGLGGFSWLVQSVGMVLPEPLARLRHQASRRDQAGGRKG